MPPDHRKKAAGSCIGVVATDAPLSPQDLERLARRVGLGLARAGSVAHHGSGEIFVAFATSDERTMRGRALDGLFQATVDATEEAVLDSLWAAVDTSGREGRTVYAFPRGAVAAPPYSGSSSPGPTRSISSHRRLMPNAPRSRTRATASRSSTAVSTSSATPAS